MEPTQKPCLTTLNLTGTLPMIAKLRLGTVRETSDGPEIKNVNWFRLDTRYKNLRDKFQAKYGEKPWQVRIALGSNDPNAVMPNQLEEWDGLIRVCQGNNATAQRMWKAIAADQQATLTNPGSPFLPVEVPCPCPHKGVTCELKARLRCILPDVQPASQVEVVTSSIINLEQIRSALEEYKTLFGRLVHIPFTLSRRPVRFCVEGESKIQYLLELVFEGDLAATNQIRQESGLEPLPYTALLESLPALDQSESQNEDVVEVPLAPAEPKPTVPAAPAAPSTPPAAPPAVSGPVTTAPRPTESAKREESHRSEPSLATPAPPATGAASKASAVPTPRVERPTAAPSRPTGSPTPKAHRPGTPPPDTTKVPAPTPSGSLICRCGVGVTERVATYSRLHHGAVLCMRCQHLPVAGQEDRKIA